MTGNTVLYGIRLSRYFRYPSNTLLGALTAMAYSINEPRAGQLRAKAIEIARALLDRNVGFLEGVRGMFGVASEFVDFERIEHFGPFIGVYSETDTFPIGEVRTRWSKEALERVDREMDEAERLYRPAIESACRELIEKWS